VKCGPEMGMLSRMQSQCSPACEQYRIQKAGSGYEIH
jgi:hypothetical protein